VEPKKTNSPTDASDATSERKPYHAPRIVYREPLEAVATACTAGSSKGSPAACPIGPVSS
jgi:hypothetical protein